jgi:hypothetical protein
MKRQMILLTAGVLILTIILLPAPSFGLATPGVTGAGEGTFPAGTTFSGVPISALNFAIGVLIYTDGTAFGQFQTTLVGTSVLGLEQDIEVEGDATAGVLNADGSRTFSGAVTVDLGDGTPRLMNVPFSVTATATSILLSLGGTNLPSVTLTGGSISLSSSTAATTAQ